MNVARTYHDATAVSE